MNTNKVKNSKSSPSVSDADRVSAYMSEFDEFERNLAPYWDDMRTNDQFYQGYNPEDPDQIPTNSGTAIIESLVARTMDVTRKVSVPVKGPFAMVNRKIEQVVSNVIDSIIDDPDVAKINGSYYQARQVLARDLYVVGNAIGEMVYTYRTEDRKNADGEDETKVVADGTSLMPHTYDEYVFNTAFTWNTSPVKYIHGFASLESLMESEYKEWTDEDGEKHTSGKYVNLDQLSGYESEDGTATLKQRTGESFSPEYYLASGNTVSQYVEDIELHWRWNGAYICLVANRSVIIWEEYDPYGIGRDPLITAMNYVYKKRPVAFGEMDWIRGIIQLKDNSFNLRNAGAERALKMGVYVSDPNANLDVIGQVLVNGGAARGSSQTVVPLNARTNHQMFLNPDEYDRQIEKTARYSQYAAGVPDAEADQTSGTASGINGLIKAAEPNFKIKLKIFEESIDTPYAQISTQTVANLTADDDVRWILRTGAAQDYIAISKRLMQGRPTWDDLINIGAVTPEQVALYTHTMSEQPVIDPTTGEHVSDENGQAMMQQVPVPIPGADKAPYVDADWSISVTLDPASAADRFQKAQGKLGLLEKAEASGVPVDWRKALPDIAAEMGNDGLEEYFVSPEQLQQQQNAALAQQQQQADAASQQAGAEHTRKMEVLTAGQQHEAKMKAMELAHAGTLAAPAMNAA